MSAVATQEKTKGAATGSAGGGQQQQQQRRPRFKSFLSHLRHRKPSAPHLKSEPAEATPRLPETSTFPEDDSVSRQSFLSDSSTSLGADEDASIRPITPGSSSHMHMSAGGDSSSSLSNLSNTTQARSTASTKPTTLFSVNSDQNGANRIAQARSGSQYPQPLHAVSPLATPSTVLRRQGSDMTSRSTAASIQFSALPPTPTHGGSLSFSSTSGSTSNRVVGQAPYYSNPHPRNNPHPSSPALDNASMVTLASSTNPGEERNERMSVIADEDASVRALPPSRRASDTSLASKMSGSMHGSSYHWNAPSSKRPASLLTVATGTSELKWEKDSHKRKSTATNCTEDGAKEDLALGSSIHDNDADDTELETAPTSPAPTDT